MIGGHYFGPSAITSAHPILIFCGQQECDLFDYPGILPSLGAIMSLSSKVVSEIDFAIVAMHKKKENKKRSNFYRE